MDNELLLYIAAEPKLSIRGLCKGLPLPHLYTNLLRPTFWMFKRGLHLKTFSHFVLNLFVEINVKIMDGTCLQLCISYEYICVQSKKTYQRWKFIEHQWFGTGFWNYKIGIWFAHHTAAMMITSDETHYRNVILFRYCDHMKKTASKPAKVRNGSLVIKKRTHVRRDQQQTNGAYWANSTTCICSRGL